MRHGQNGRKMMLGVAVVAAVAALASVSNTASRGVGIQANARTQTSANVSYPMTVTDEAGNKVTLKHQPVRIASVTEGTDEILADLVPIKDLVLVTTYGKDPQYSFVAAKIKNIPAIQNATAEAIIAQRPDLVFLASYTTPGVVRQIQQAGISVYELADFNSIAEIERNILNIGQVVGESSKAHSIVNHMKSRLAAIHEAVVAAGGDSSATVLDYSQDKYVGGRNTTIDSIITAAGAANAAAKINGWQAITDEQLVAMNPSSLIFMRGDAKFGESVLHNPKFRTVAAIRHHDVHLLSDADLSTVSQYIVNTVADLAEAMNPRVKIPQ